ncbi:MAG: hypothetical protein IRZ21_06910 [Thermoleophilaceae bacterium]|nr:hypothetical protein [Thermoleophilaceae bacterium]
MSARRRRALALIALALACGGLAASRVRGRERAVEERVGAPVPVLVARADLHAGERLAARLLERREVPARFVPPDALSDPREAAALRAAVPIPRGGYLTAGVLAERGTGTAAGAPLRRGERAVEVAVAGADVLAGAGPGARVDVVATAAAGSGGGGRSWLALEDVELLALRPGGEPATADGARSGGTALATLRVTLRQAVFLTAVQSFAREIRLLARPAGEPARGRRVEESL